MSTRNLGGITTANLQTSIKCLVHFIRFDIGGGVGAKRFVIDSSDDLTLNVDGTGAQVWKAADIILGPMNQNMQRMLSVSSLSIANIDWTWTTWVNTAGTNSLRGTPVQVWRAQYDVNGTLWGSYPLYQGRLDNGDYGARANVACIPYTITWGRTWPWSVSGALCPYVYKDTDTCQSTSTDTDCPRTRLACQTRTGGSNEAHFGGDDLMPRLNVAIPWGTSLRRGF
jgi:hypothetical protein